MPENIIHQLFVVAMICMAVIGAYCSHKLSSDNPRWVRLVVLAPSVFGMFAPVVLAMGIYEPYAFDVAFAIAVALLYALVASRFSDTPWLDLRTKKGQ